jgi:hypothetical protein
METLQKRVKPLYRKKDLSEFSFEEKQDILEDILPKLRKCQIENERLYKHSKHYRQKISNNDEEYSEHRVIRNINLGGILQTVDEWNAYMEFKSNIEKDTANKIKAIYYRRSYRNIIIFNIFILIIWIILIIKVIIAICSIFF